MAEAFLLSHLGLGDNICLAAAAVYLSTIHDRVWFVVKEKYASNMRLFFQNHDNIELYVVRDDDQISPRAGFPEEEFRRITKNKTLYISGLHRPVGYKTDFTQFPLCFYDDMGLDRNIFSHYFPQLEIYDEHFFDVLGCNKPIVFCHDQSSYQSANLLDRRGLSLEDNIVINPCINMYPPTHRFYDIAQKYVYLPLVSYIPLIKNSDIIIMFDSSIWCMTLHLETKEGAEKFCYYRHDGSKHDVHPGYKIADPSFQYIPV